MSYIDDLTEAVVKVVTHACDGLPEKFAGYAANRAFWVAEAAHVLQVIDGYYDRFNRMHAASMAHHRGQLSHDFPARPVKLPSMNASDLAGNKRQLREAMKRFLARCLKLHPNEFDEVMDDCNILGIQEPI